MKIAVTYDQGMVFPHFGHTQQFKIYTIKANEVISAEIINTNGAGHCALASFLVENEVEALICGGIGMGAQVALQEVGIKLLGGVSGDADKAVEDYIAGNLNYNPEVRCDHHDHHHGEGHVCGNHGCGANHIC